jgi:hypothetical protein
VTASATPASYTASFTTQFYLTTSAGAGGSISPASGWYNAGSVVSVSASANAGNLFSGFSNGLSGTTTPQNVTMNAPVTVAASFAAVFTETIVTSPAGLALTIDGTACTSPCSPQWTAGSTHTIATSATQAGATGTQYVFGNWSDAGGLSHTVTAPASAASYTANFTTHYYLTTSAGIGGTVAPPSGWYNSGSAVAVSATPAASYQFTGFTGGLTGTASPQNVTLTGPVTVTAGFIPLQTVTSVPAGLLLTVDAAPCTTPCTFPWTSGSSHTLAAGTIAGPTGTQSVFVAWSQGGSASQTITAAATPTAYTATYKTQYYLTTSAGTGGSISPASAWYDAGTPVSISAIADSPYYFSAFSGDLSGATTPQTVSLTAPKSVVASFATIPTTMVTTSPSALQVTVDGTTCTAPCAFQWTPGTSHTLTAATQPGTTGTQYAFASWSQGGAASQTITASSSTTTYAAAFNLQYLLTTAVSPTTGGTITPTGGWYNSGAAVSVGVTVNNGYLFSGFSGSLSGSITPQSLTMTGPASVTATFLQAPLLTLSSTHSGDFTQGQTGATYSLIVSNASAAGPTSGTVAVTETIPTGLMPVSMAGSGWTCGLTNCTRSDALSGGSSYPAITVTVNVATNAPSQVANQATVSGGGSPSSPASDPTTVDALPRYSNPLAFATSASVVAGVPTTLTVTYASDNGPADIASGQVKIDNCYLAWDHSGNVTLFVANGVGFVSSILGSQTLLSAGNCSIDLSNSSLSTPSGNPKALVLRLNITFPAQAYPSTDDLRPSPEFVGPHEVYAWGTSAGGLASGQVDLGSLVVSQGQDFTLTVGTSEAVNLGTNATLNVTVSAAGLNGFSGSIPLGVQVIAGSPCFGFMGNGQYSVQTNGQTTITVKNNNCTSGYMAFTVHGSAIGIRRITSVVSLIATASGDFSVGVGTPSPAVLQPQSSISYPVIVSSSNGQTGYVNLSLDAWDIPAGVSSSFSPPQVYLSGSGSTATSYLTLYSSANTPPGTYPLRVLGNLGSVQHAATFSLSTQVTTFQVTSATGSAIAHNTGQEVQVTHTVTSGNVPANATCDSADPDVTCRVISSSPGTVRLGVTATSGAAHGTRVLSMNKGATTVHAIVADYIYAGMLGLSPGSIQAGAPPTKATLSVLGVPPCELYGYCGNPEVIVDSPVEADITGWNANTFSVSLYAGASTKAANYEISLSLCGGYVDAWDEINTEACVAGPAFLQVTAASPPICTLDFQYRGLAFPLLGLVVGHSYLHFTQSDNPVIDYVFEGEQSGDSGISGCGGALVAWAGPHGLADNHPDTDSSATTNGPLRGAYVCDWRGPLQDAVSRINAAHIPYACTGPNSNSVARYMLSRLPYTITPWWAYPGGLIGFYTLLPGVEQ